MTDFAARRVVMVDTQVRPSDVTKFPIIDAMLRVPRENFVPAGRRETAYMGETIELAGGALLLEPRTFAKMLDAADFQGHELVLDIGSAMGYSSAVIARMTEAVVAVEADKSRAEEAISSLAELGSDNVYTHSGPSAEGAPEHGPYDSIMIQGGVETIPGTILDQLKDEGRIIALFMEGALGSVRIGHKHQGKMVWRFAFNAAAPVLPGFEKLPSFAL